MASELLKGFRMLDLTDEKGALCGKIFADLGAEVIKVEPPEGCSTRRIPPFLDDLPGADRGLYFLAYEASKRSLTLNLEIPDARELLGELVKQADFIVESFPPGYLDARGIGYEALARLNPRLVHTSIMPFGDKGPARDYKAADIVTWAAGGVMYLMGEPGRPPLQMSLPQAGLHAGGEAAVASLLAHFARGRDGLGQQVVVDMQACIVWALMNEQAMPILHGNYLRRAGAYAGGLGMERKVVYRCKDGHISALVVGGPGGAMSTRALIAWMEEGDFAAPWMRQKDWVTWTPGVFMKATTADIEEVHDLEERIERFFMTMTKAEIYAGALKRRILLAPVSTVADIAADPQLKARDFFVTVAHDTLGRALTLPGPFVKLSATPIEAPMRAPRLGEHNREILSGLLGLDNTALTRLRAIGAT
ncbi:MAG: CaiB/BaiF CoA transferase family protein [Candidatus Binataceae bacterium]